MRRLLLVSLVVAAVAAPSADAVIVPGQSIAGVRLGMTQTQVRGVLGPPSSIRQATNVFGPFTVFRYFRLRVTFQGRENVTAVKTWRKRERTARGIGRGSTRAQVLARVSGVQCQRGLCTKGQLVPGGRVTVFRTFNARVTSVEVGFVID